MNTDRKELALRLVNATPAMIAYWDRDQNCIFANEAYLLWFGRRQEEMIGMSLQELLGPSLYRRNLPHILAALRGEKQVFERQIACWDGKLRDCMATYTPDVAEGVVNGFSVLVADVTVLRQREVALEQTIRERDEAQAQVRILRGLLPICAGCKRIRDENGKWNEIEKYVSARSEATFTHGYCPTCAPKYFPGLDISHYKE